MEEFLAQNQWVIWLIVVWTLPWKAVALWKASRNSQKGWFIALLFVNSLAILEIVYIFWFGKRKETDKINGDKESKP